MSRVFNSIASFLAQLCLFRPHIAQITLGGSLYDGVVGKPGQTYFALATEFKAADGTLQSVRFSLPKVMSALNTAEDAFKPVDMNPFRCYVVYTSSNVTPPRITEIKQHFEEGTPVPSMAEDLFLTNMQAETMQGALHVTLSTEEVLFVSAVDGYIHVICAYVHTAYFALPEFSTSIGTYSSADILQNNSDMQVIPALAPRQSSPVAAIFYHGKAYDGSSSAASGLGEISFLTEIVGSAQQFVTEGFLLKVSLPFIATSYANMDYALLPKDYSTGCFARLSSEQMPFTGSNSLLQAYINGFSGNEMTVSYNVLIDGGYVIWTFATPTEGTLGFDRGYMEILCFNAIAPTNPSLPQNAIMELTLTDIKLFTTPNALLHAIEADGTDVSAVTTFTARGIAFDGSPDIGNTRGEGAFSITTKFRSINDGTLHKVVVQVPWYRSAINLVTSGLFSMLENQERVCYVSYSLLPVDLGSQDALQNKYYINPSSLNSPNIHRFSSISDESITGTLVSVSLVLEGAVYMSDEDGYLQIFCNKAHISYEPIAAGIIPGFSVSTYNMETILTRAPNSYFGGVSPRRTTPTAIIEFLGTAYEGGSYVDGIGVGALSIFTEFMTFNGLFDGDSFNQTIKVKPHESIISGRAAFNIAPNHQCYVQVTSSRIPPTDPTGMLGIYLTSNQPSDFIPILGISTAQAPDYEISFTAAAGSMEQPLQRGYLDILCTGVYAPVEAIPSYTTSASQTMQGQQLFNTNVAYMMEVLKSASDANDVASIRVTGVAYDGLERSGLNVGEGIFTLVTKFRAIEGGFVSAVEFQFPFFRSGINFDEAALYPADVQCYARYSDLLPTTSAASLTEEYQNDVSIGSLVNVHTFSNVQLIPSSIGIKYRLEFEQPPLFSTTDGYIEIVCTNVHMPLEAIEQRVLESSSIFVYNGIHLVSQASKPYFYGVKPRSSMPVARMIPHGVAWDGEDYMSHRGSYTLLVDHIGSALPSRTINIRISNLFSPVGDTQTAFVPDGPASCYTIVHPTMPLEESSLRNFYRNNTIQDTNARSDNVFVTYAINTALHLTLGVSLEDNNRRGILEIFCYNLPYPVTEQPQMQIPMTVILQPDPGTVVVFMTTAFGRMDAILPRTSTPTVDILPYGYARVGALESPTPGYGYLRLMTEFVRYRQSEQFALSFELPLAPPAQPQFPYAFYTAAQSYSCYFTLSNAPLNFYDPNSLMYNVQRGTIHSGQNQYNMRAYSTVALNKLTFHLSSDMINGELLTHGYVEIVCDNVVFPYSATPDMHDSTLRFKKGSEDLFVFHDRYVPGVRSQAMVIPVDTLLSQYTGNDLFGPANIEDVLVVEHEPTQAERPSNFTISYMWRGMHRGMAMNREADTYMVIRIYRAQLTNAVEGVSLPCSLLYNGETIPTEGYTAIQENYAYIMMRPTPAHIEPWTRSISNTESTLYGMKCTYISESQSTLFQENMYYPMRAQSLRLGLIRRNSQFDVFSSTNNNIYTHLSGITSALMSPEFTGLFDKPQLIFGGPSIGSFGELHLSLHGMNMLVDGSIAILLNHQGEFSMSEEMYIDPPVCFATDLTTSNPDGPPIGPDIPPGGNDGIPYSTMQLHEEQPSQTVTLERHNRRKLVFMNSQIAGNVNFTLRCYNFKLPYNLAGTTTQSLLIGSTRVPLTTIAPTRAIYNQGTLANHFQYTTRGDALLYVHPVGMSLPSGSSVRFKVLPSAFMTSMSSVLISANAMLATVAFSATCASSVNIGVLTFSVNNLLTIDNSLTLTAAIDPTYCMKFTFTNVKMIATGVYAEYFRISLAPTETPGYIPFPNTFKLRENAEQQYIVSDTDTASTHINFNQGQSSQVLRQTMDVRYTVRVNAGNGPRSGDLVIIQHYPTDESVCTLYRSSVGSANIISWTAVGPVQYTMDAISKTTAFSVQDVYSRRQGQQVFRVNGNMENALIDNMIITCSNALLPPFISGGTNGPGAFVTVRTFNSNTGRNVIAADLRNNMFPLNVNAELDLVTTDVNMAQINIHIARKQTADVIVKVLIPRRYNATNAIPTFAEFTSTNWTWNKQSTNTVCMQSEDMQNDPIPMFSSHIVNNTHDAIQLLPTPKNTGSMQITCHQGTPEGTAVTTSSMEQAVAVELLLDPLNVRKRRYSMYSTSLDQILADVEIPETLQKLKEELRTPLSVPVHYTYPSYTYMTRPFVRDPSSYSLYGYEVFASEWEDSPRLRFNDEGMSMSFGEVQRFSEFSQLRMQITPEPDLFKWQMDLQFSGDAQRESSNFTGIALSTQSSAYLEHLDINSVSLGNGFQMKSYNKYDQTIDIVDNFMIISSGERKVYGRAAKFARIAAPLGLRESLNTPYFARNVLAALEKTATVNVPNAYASYSNFTSWNSPGAIFSITFDYINAYMQYKDIITFDMMPGSLYATAQGVCSSATITEAISTLRQNTQCSLHASNAGHSQPNSSKSYPLRIVSLATQSSGYNYECSVLETKLPVSVVTVEVSSAIYILQDSSVSIKCTHSTMTLPAAELAVRIQMHQLGLHVDMKTALGQLYATTRYNIKYTTYGILGNGIPLLGDDMPSTEITVKRIIAPGYVLYGDDETPTEIGQGTLYVQMDLPVGSGTSLNSGSKIQFGVQTRAVGLNYAFSSLNPNEQAAGIVQCYMSTTVTVIATTKDYPLRKLYYTNARIDDHADVFRSFSTKFDIETFNGAQEAIFTIDTRSAWRIPTLSVLNSNYKQVLEIQCVNLRYPTDAIPSNEMSMMRAFTETGVSIYNTGRASFTGVKIKEKKNAGLISVSSSILNPNPYSVGNITFTVANVQFDLVENTNLEILFPDSHQVEFKVFKLGAPPSDFTETKYSNSTCFINNIPVRIITAPTYSRHQHPSIKPQQNAMIDETSLLSDTDDIIPAKYKGSVQNEPVEEQPVTSTTSYEYNNVLRVSLAHHMNLRDHVSTDLVSMSLHLVCTNVRLPAATDLGQFKFVLYEQNFADLVAPMREENPQIAFSGLTSGVIAAITNKISFLPAIVESIWGKTVATLVMTNMTAGSDPSILTLTMKPMMAGISTRGVIDFKLPSSWVLPDITSTHMYANETCKGSITSGTPSEADITGLTIMNAAKKQISFYPHQHIYSTSGEFVLFCGGVRLPSLAKVATTTTLRAYDTMIPFNWVPGYGEDQTVLTGANYAFPTRQMIMSNDNVTIPRISKTRAPLTLVTHAITLTVQAPLDQNTLDRMQKAYNDVLAQAIATGKVKPDGVVSQGGNIMIMYKQATFSNEKVTREIIVDDVGTIEIDIVVEVQFLLEGVGGTDSYMLRNLILANRLPLAEAASHASSIFVTDVVDPVAVMIPGSCSNSEFDNDGNLSDTGCGRGCAKCRVGKACFDHSDCITNKCSNMIQGDASFTPILDETLVTERDGVKGVCISADHSYQTWNVYNTAPIQTTYSSAIVILVFVLICMG